MNMADEQLLSRARRLHQHAIVVDLHCDTTQRWRTATWDIGVRDTLGHVDLPRMREGGVDAAFFAVWAPELKKPGAGVTAAREQILRISNAARSFDQQIILARTAGEVRAAHAAGAIAILIAIEGGHLIEESLEVLREYHAGGAAYLTLTHSFHNALADSSGVHENLAPLHGGLSPFGREVVGELNRLGMMVDVSHVSDAAFWEVVEISSAPIVATHSSCRALMPHRRNLTDDMMRAVAESGGTVNITFVACFIDPTHPPIDAVCPDEYLTKGVVAGPVSSHITPLEVLVDHFDHALQVVGPDHVGIGSDFDGAPVLPAGMEDCSKLPNLTAALLGRGYSEEDLAKVLGENILRVMDECARTAAGLRGTGPSDSTAEARSTS